MPKVGWHFFGISTCVHNSRINDYVQVNLPGQTSSSKLGGIHFMFCFCTYLAKHHHLSSVVYILCFVSAYLGVWFCWWGICFSLSLLDCPLLHQLRCYYKSSIFFCHLKRGFFFFFNRWKFCEHWNCCRKKTTGPLS
jgi:hypothetical protein